jgi:hypothetical protein
VIARVASDRGGVAYRELYVPSDDDPDQFTTEWVVLARNADDLAAITADSRWERLAVTDGARPWTDDYSNLLDAIRR